MKKTYLIVCVVVLMTTVFAACGGSGNTDETVATDTTASEPLNFGPLNKLSLNDATAEEFAMIPGVGRRMVREFLEYRPYISIEQFRREMAKYVEADTIAAYEKYVYVPVAYNESDVATLTQIPGMTPEFAQTLIDGRPYDSKDAFLARVLAVTNDGSIEQFARHYVVEKSVEQE
jgi:DNA uptake protein ComE-like DNA-binding protein